MSLSADLIILNNLDQEIVSYTDGPAQSDNGGTVETLIDRTYTLPNNIIYKIKFNTTATNPAGAQYATAMSVVVVTESTPAAASVTEITNSLLGAASLTASTTPTSGNNDDGFWTLALPFSIDYLGTSYNTIYVGTNTYITFGNGSTQYTNLSATNPNLPKIMWSCADNSVQRIYYGTEGTSPNRTYRVRVEGNAAVSGTVGSPGMVCEWTFYEAVPDRIDLQQGVNNRKTSGGGFTTQQLNDWGFISGQRIPVRRGGHKAWSCYSRKVQKASDGDDRMARTSSRGHASPALLPPTRELKSATSQCCTVSLMDQAGDRTGEPHA